MFDVDEDDATPPSTVGPAPPLPITVHVLVGKWVDGGNKALDLEDLDLLSEIMDIPQEVSSILLPLSDAVNVWQILDFKLPNITMGPSNRLEHHALIECTRMRTWSSNHTYLQSHGFTAFESLSVMPFVMESSRSSIPNSKTNCCLFGY
jgi:hypothetical protein